MKLFGGIDPGKNGAVAIITEDMRVLSVDDLPICDRKATGGYRPLDILKLLRKRCPPGIHVGVEWPQTRPGEGAQRSRNFGLGLGYLEMALIALGVEWERLDPVRWKHRLGLPGKGDTTASWLVARKATIDLYESLYPAYKHLILGPRRGIRLDRCEAVLMADFLRRRTAGGIRATVNKFGRDSDQAMMMIFGGRRRRLKTPGSDLSI